MSNARRFSLSYQRFPTRVGRRNFKAHTTVLLSINSVCGLFA